MELETDEFRLRLSSDWVQYPGEEPNQFQFWSEQKGSSIVMSYLQAEIPADKRQAAAQTILDAALQAHADLGDADIADTWVEEDAAADFVFCGYDGSNREAMFHRRGWVTGGKVLNLWVSTETRDAQYSNLVLGEVIAGLEFTVP